MRARVNCIMQISVVPAESSAGGKRSIKIHGHRRWIAGLSRVSATTVSSNCIFRRARQPGSPRREFLASNGPRYRFAPAFLRVFSLGNKVFAVVAERDVRTRTERCHFSRCTTPLFFSLSRHGGATAGRGCIYSCFVAFPSSRASRRAVTKAISASRFSPSCISLAREHNK